MHISTRTIPPSAIHFENAFLSMRSAGELHQAVVESEDSTSNFDAWSKEMLDESSANLTDARAELALGIRAIETLRPKPTTLIERLRTDLTMLDGLRAAVLGFDLDMHLPTELSGAMRDARAGQRLLGD